MIMAFLTRQFCSDPAEAITLFHDIWDGTKRREPAQPQRLRWQIRGLALLATILRGCFQESMKTVF